MALGFASAGAEPTVPIREVRLVMGTRAEVQVGGLGTTAGGAALDAAFEALDRVDRSMSLWKESELTRLNRTGSAQASGDLQAVLVGALDIASASNGAFDPTVEPFVRAAGGTGQPPRALDERERRELLARVGPRHVHLDPTSGAVELDPGTTLDLGGLAKGYAVDLALAALRAAGATSGLVDLGSSSISAFGMPLTLEVRDPERVDAPGWASFALSEGHVSTSANDQQKDHLLDPHTGKPARKVLAATAMARSGMEADALSTAVFVLGPTEGLALLERRGARGFVLGREGGHAVIWTTPGLTAACGLRAAPSVAVRELSGPLEPGARIAPEASPR
jgi:thiamine biosynthesis lipoprotein